MTAKKPTSLKLLDGNPGKTAINKNEPIPANDLCKPPAGMTDAAVEHWNKIISESPPGLLKETDYAEMKILCVSLSIYDEAYDKVKDMGLVLIAKTGMPYPNPFLPIMTKQVEIIRGCCSTLGLTPVARTRLSMPDQNPKGASPFAAFTKK